MNDNKKYSFVEIVDSIFKNKENYRNISDEDKENNFFIINRKFSRKYPKIGKLFNNKYIDKASALDRWYILFNNEKDTPYWYWNKKKPKISEISDSDKLYLMERYNMKEHDIDYLLKYYREDVLQSLKSKK